MNTRRPWWAAVSVVLASSIGGIARPAAAAGWTERRHALGYQRGTGLGYAGASGAIALTPRLTFDAQVFVLPSATARGFGLAPIVEARLFDGDGFSPYVALGPLYQRVWFGDAGAGGGFGGSVTVGCELRLKGGVAFQLGAGLGSRQDITATRDIRTTTQQGTFGPHWDFSVRYWF